MLRGSIGGRGEKKNTKLYSKKQISLKGPLMNSKGRSAKWSMPSIEAQMRIIGIGTKSRAHST